MQNLKASFLKPVVFVLFQLNTDCLEEIPADYEMSGGGPSTNPISGASEITVNESSVVLDPADRGIGLEQLQHDAETELQEGESHLMASSEFTRLTDSCTKVRTSS